MASLNVIDIVGEAPEASLFIPYSQLPKHLQDQQLVVSGRWNGVIHVTKAKTPDFQGVEWNRGGAIIALDAEHFGMPRGTYKLENLTIKQNGQNIMVTGINDATMEARGIKPVAETPYHLTPPKAVPGQQLEIPPKTIFKIRSRISYRPAQGLVITFDKSTSDVDIPESYVVFVRNQNRYRIALTSNSQKGYKIRNNNVHKTREIVLSGKTCEMVFGVVQPIAEPTDYEFVFVKSPDSNVIWSKFEPPGFLDNSSDKNQDVAAFLQHVQELNGLASRLKQRGLTIDHIAIQSGKIASVDIISNVQTTDHGFAVETTKRVLTYKLTKV